MRFVFKSCFFLSIVFLLCAGHLVQAQQQGPLWISGFEYEHYFVQIKSFSGRGDNSAKAKQSALLQAYNYQTAHYGTYFPKCEPTDSGCVTRYIREIASYYDKKSKIYYLLVQIKKRPEYDYPETWESADGYLRVDGIKAGLVRRNETLEPKPSVENALAGVTPSKQGGGSGIKSPVTNSNSRKEVKKKEQKTPTKRKKIWYLQWQDAHIALGVGVGYGFAREMECPVSFTYAYGFKLGGPVVLETAIGPSWRVAVAQRLSVMDLELPVGLNLDLGNHFFLGGALVPVYVLKALEGREAQKLDWRLSAFQNDSGEKQDLIESGQMGRFRVDAIVRVGFRFWTIFQLAGYVRFESLSFPSSSYLIEYKRIMYGAMLSLVFCY